MNSKISSMKTPILFLLLTIYLFISTSQAAQDDSFAIYLIRHAEKNTLPPADLTSCGLQRSKDLIKVFQNIDFDVIYSTDVLRSISTAQPIAEQRNLPIELYDRPKLTDFAKKLLQQKKNALVVGHLNTTPMLAGFLSDNSYDMIKGPDYSRIYQVVVIAGQPHVSILHQSFKCSETEASP
ncbi:phosphoglycerate mutase family protein [uncultured Paraglaciecola sp.]|uniref:phosphoglycerate mutase family protein n=1 Tax=uncultured Paraglaciecola sp. TaxID=1765024 RepID=UPI0030DD7662|tara:strand:- start:75824 stop:76366 length:543 start_codon:yes stop_codon:yes gene_type:complete